MTIKSVLPASPASFGQGSVFYADAANSIAALAPNTTTTTKYLSQVGNGTTASAPAWSQFFSTETVLNSPVAGGTDSVLGTTNRYYASGFTMPTTYKLWQVTGFEALNGTVAAGTFIMGLWSVDANPPVTNGETLLAYCAATAMSGTSAVQRVNVLSSQLIPAGKLVMPSLSTNDGTARYGTTAGASQKRQKGVVLNSDIPNGDTTAWITDTVEPYIKVYGIGYIPA